MEGFYDKIIVNDDLQATFEQLERYILASDDEPSDIAQLDGAQEVEATMESYSKPEDISEPSAMVGSAMEVDGVTAGADDAEATK